MQSNEIPPRVVPPSISQAPRVDLDLEQWRRDVQTFVQVTTAELNAINSELSTGGDQFTSVLSEAALPVNESSYTAPPRPLAEQTSSETDNRLASLREKIARRMSN